MGKKHVPDYADWLTWPLWSLKQAAQLLHEREPMDILIWDVKPQPDWPLVKAVSRLSLMERVGSSVAISSRPVDLESEFKFYAGPKLHRTRLFLRQGLVAGELTGKKDEEGQHSVTPGSLLPWWADVHKRELPSGLQDRDKWPEDRDLGDASGGSERPSRRERTLLRIIGVMTELLAAHDEELLKVDRDGNPTDAVEHGKVIEALRGEPANEFSQVGDEFHGFGTKNLYRILAEARKELAASREQLAAKREQAKGREALREELSAMERERGR